MILQWIFLLDLCLALVYTKKNSVYCHHESLWWQSSQPEEASMPVNLKGRSFLTLKDFTPEEIRYLLDLSKDLKAKKRAGVKGDALYRKNIVLLFDKTSTRTRCAFETACWDEGGNATYLTNSQMGKKESVEDTARVLGRMYDGIQYRGYSQKLVEDLAKYSGVPVWNGLTDEDHPTQILADLLTIEEHVAKPLSKVKLVYCGDARNQYGQRLMIGCAKMGMKFVALAPKELWPQEKLTQEMREVAAQNGGSIEFFTIDRADAALAGADALYTDVWVSMGEEDKFAERIALLENTASPWTLCARPTTRTSSSFTVCPRSTIRKPMWARTSKKVWS